MSVQEIVGSRQYKPLAGETIPIALEHDFTILGNLEKAYAVLEVTRPPMHHETMRCLLADAAGLPEAEIYMSCQKDEYATSSQLVFLPSHSIPTLSRHSWKAEPLKVRLVGWSANPQGSQSHKGNRFSFLLRVENAHRQKIEERLAAIRDIGFWNFFFSTWRFGLPRGVYGITGTMIMLQKYNRAAVEFLFSQSPNESKVLHDTRERINHAYKNHNLDVCVTLAEANDELRDEATLLSELQRLGSWEIVFSTHDSPARTLVKQFILAWRSRGWNKFTSYLAQGKKLPSSIATDKRRIQLPDAEMCTRTAKKEIPKTYHKLLSPSSRNATSKPSAMAWRWETPQKLAIEFTLSRDASPIVLLEHIFDVRYTILGTKYTKR